VTITKEQAQEIATGLTPRQRQVVALVGGGQLSYKAAAARMKHRYARTADQSVTAGTVKQYATQVRERMALPIPPRSALTLLFFANPDLFEEGGDV